MLIYNPKGTSLAGPTDPPVGGGLPAGIGTPAAASVTVPEAQTLVADNAVSEILPAGGLKILNATEPLAQKVSKGAQDALAKAITQVCLDGIRSMAIVKYVVGFASMMAADRGKRSKDLLFVTARLRAWSVISKANLVALCESDNPEVVSALQGLMNTSKVLGIPEQTIAGFIADTKALKEAESKLFASQLRKEGGGTFKLYEWNGFGIPETTSTGWYGPVAVRPRVAKFVKNEDAKTVEQIKALFNKPLLEDTIPIDKVPVFPVPDILFGKADLSYNPSFTATILGAADIIPYEEYSKDGAGIGSGLYHQDFSNESYVTLMSAFFNSLVKVTYLKSLGTLDFSTLTYVVPKDAKQVDAVYKNLIREQANRIFAVRDDDEAKDLKQMARITDSASVGDYIVGSDKNSNQLGVASGQWAAFGDMVDNGLRLDPEWGGSGFDDTKTLDQIMDAALPLVRKYQDTYRNKVALKTDEGNKKLKPVGTYAEVLVKEGAIKSATTDMAIVPVLPTTWAQTKGNPVLYPHLVDVTAWKKYMTNPDAEAYQSFKDSVDFWSSELWGGAGPNVGLLLDDMADCLGTGSKWNKLYDYKPDANGKMPSQLPYPLVYKYDAIAPKLPQYLTLSMGKYSEVSGKQITDEQQDLIDVRSEYKSTVLLAMRAAEFAGTVLDSTKALVQAIKNLTKILYGDCPIEEAPDKMPKEELYEFYLKQTDACAASPKDGSLLDTLNKANDLYKDLLAKEAAGSASASQTLQVVAQQIAKTQERVNVLVAELKGKLQQVKGNIEDDGGLFYFINTTVNLLDTLDKLPKVVVIGGVSYNAEPSQEEKDAIEETKKKIKSIQIEGFKVIGFIGAQAQTLTNVGDSYSIDFGTSVGGGLKEIKDWAVNTLGTKKPFPWWLLLLAAAAASKEK